MRFARPTAPETFSFPPELLRGTAGDVRPGYLPVKAERGEDIDFGVTAAKRLPLPGVPGRPVDGDENDLLFFVGLRGIPPAMALAVRLLGDRGDGGRSCDGESGLVADCKAILASLEIADAAVLGTDRVDRWVGV